MNKNDNATPLTLDVNNETGNSGRKKNIKRILGFFYLITFVALLYAGITYIRKPKTTEETPSTSITETPTEQAGENPIPSPQFANQYPDGKPNTRVQLAIQKFPAFPKTGNVYEIKNEGYSDQQISQLASEIGFTKKPALYDSKIDGKIYIYSQDGVGSLRVEAKGRMIDFKGDTPPTENISGTINNEEISKAVFAFLEKIKIIDTNSLSLKTASAVNIDEPGSGKPANAINAQFTKKVDELPLYASTFDTGVVTATLNNKKEIIALYVDDIGELTEKGRYAIKDESEFKETLGEAIVQSLYGKNITSEYDTTVFAVTSVLVNQIELSYVQDTTQNILQPVFVLRGNAVLNTGGGAQAVLYLPALSKLQ